jgi:predicted regulator of Ras-like GTPase activity (Roadblock/LC7/MglB family)
MDAQKKLSRLAAIDGFMGTALLSAEGQLLAQCEPFDSDLNLIASLANSLFIGIHKTSLDMGFGSCPFAYVHTEKALILLRCLNEGKNPLRAEPGKAHIHLVLLVDNPESLGIAKLEMAEVIQSLAEHFRMPVPQEQDPKPKLHEVAHSLDQEHIAEIFDALLV